MWNVARVPQRTTVPSPDRVTPRASACQAPSRGRRDCLRPFLKVDRPSASPLARRKQVYVTDLFSESFGRAPACPSWTLTRPPSPASWPRLLAKSCLPQTNCTTETMPVWLTRPNTLIPTPPLAAPSLPRLALESPARLSCRALCCAWMVATEKESPFLFLRV